MMAKIAVDIDDTLYNFNALARLVMSELAVERDDARLQAAAYASWDEWRSPLDLAGAENWAEVIKLCHRPERIIAQVPLAGARDALDHLTLRGHELIYVSNRDPAVDNVTWDWLKEHGFPCRTLLCHTEDKLASIRDCQYLIDDRPQTLVGFIARPMEDGHGLPYEQGFDRRAFGLVTPYNRALTDVPGIYLAPSWPLLSRYLQAKIP